MRRGKEQYGLMSGCRGEAQKSSTPTATSIREPQPSVFPHALVGVQGLRLPWCPRGVMAFKRPLKNKGIQEERVTTRRLDDLGQSTTLQSNKSPSRLCTTSASEAKRCLVRSLSYSSHKTLESHKSATGVQARSSEPGTARSTGSRTTPKSTVRSVIGWARTRSM